MNSSVTRARHGARRSALIVAATLAPAIAAAEPIVVSRAFNFITTIGNNTVNIQPGVYQNIGAHASPNGSAGTTAVAYNADLPAGSTGSGSPASGDPGLPVRFVGSTAAPNQFQRFTPYVQGVSPTSGWTLVFSNPGYESTTIVTPDIAGAVTVGPAYNVAMLAGGASPTFSWSTPAGFDPESVGIDIYDRTTQRADGFFNRIYSSSQMAGTTTSFTIPQALTIGNAYTLDVIFNIRRPDGSVVSRSDTFVDFTPIPGSLPGAVYLPEVTNGASGAPPVYGFNISGVGPEGVTYIDPEVAVGYEYRTAAGDPNFRSVILPTGIAGWYVLVYPDGTEVMIEGGKEFSFLDYASAGIDRFTIKGIPTSAGLDPDDTMAFITGLSFVSSGSFRGTMTPIIEQVPLPGSLALAGIGLVALWARRCRGRSTAGGVLARTRAIVVLADSSVSMSRPG